MRLRFSFRGRRRALLLFLGTTLLATGGKAQETGPWTLKAALEQARAAHPDAQIGRAQVEAAQAAQRQTESQRWPQVQLQGRYQQTTHPMQGFGAILSQGTFDPTVNFNDPGQLDALSAGLEVVYPVYTGGRRTAQIKSATAHANAATNGLSARLAGLSNAVVQAYFEIRRADAVMASINAGIEVLDENLRVSRAREASGDLIKTERLNLEVELARLSRERLGIAHQQRLARSSFAFYLGLDPSTPITLAVDDPSVLAMPIPLDGTGPERPEVSAARARVEAAEFAVEAARSGQRPAINAFARADWEKGFRREGSGESWTAGLSLAMPVFDGFQTKARAQQALAQLREAEAALRQIELSIALEIEGARLAHELSIAQLEVTRVQVRQAQEAAALSRDRFAAGTLLSTELIGVESRLVEAEVQEALAVNAERAALARYRRALGLVILP